MGNYMGIVTIDSSRVKASGVLLFNWEGESGVYRLSDIDGHLVVGFDQAKIDRFLSS